MCIRDSAESKAWFLKVSQGNAGGLHRVTKVVTLTPKQSFMNKARGSPMALVEEQVCDWEVTWKCASKVAGPWRHDRSGQIAPLTGDDIGRTRDAFNAHTATATDALHPKSYGNASSEITESTAALLNACERNGAWPSQVSELHVPVSYTHLTLQTKRIV